MVIAINLLMSFIVLPRMNVAFLAEPQWGATSLSAVGGVWSVIVALLCAVVAAVAINFRSVPELRATMTAGSNAAVLPIVSVASLVGFGAIVAALPSFALVREWVLGIEGGPLVSLRHRYQYPRRAHWFGIGRPHHRARRARTHLYEARR